VQAGLETNVNKKKKKEVRTLERLKGQKDSSNSWNSSINIMICSEVSIKFQDSGNG
jgi:hypothetical protein